MNMNGKRKEPDSKGRPESQGGPQAPLVGNSGTGAQYGPGHPEASSQPSAGRRHTTRKWILIWAAFLVVLVAGDRVGALLLDAMVLRSEIRFSRLYRGGMNADILVLGDSRGAGSFLAPLIEKLTGLQCLNLSHNAMSTELMEALLNDYLEHNRPPRLLLMEATNLNSASRGPVQGLRMYLRYSKRLTDLAWTYDERNVIASKISALYTFNSDMLLRALYYRDKSDQAWVNAATIQPSLVQQAASGPLARLPVPIPENVRAMKRILETAREMNIAVRVVVAPYLPEHRAKLENLQQWIAGVELMVGDGAQVFDFSAAVPDSTGFADRVHVNAGGAATFTTALFNQGVLTPPPPAPPSGK